MSSENASTITPPRLVDRVALAKANPRVQSAAHWFWWIAGLSVVNSAVLLAGGTFNFVLGLAVTQVADGIFQNLRFIALFFDVCVVGFFVAMGAFAAKGYGWAFWVGGLAYLADGLVFAVFGDWIPAAFHAYALFCIVQGLIALRTAVRTAETAASVTPPAAPDAPAPALSVAAAAPVTTGDGSTGNGNPA
jgi:hypothetical protein